MASRTQLRLGQITGSFGTSAINDQIAAAATGSIATTDLQGVLSHLAGAIKRINGADSFSEGVAGEFSQNIVPADANGQALGSATKEWADLYLGDGAVINLGNDQDVTITHVADTGVLLNGASQIQLRDSAIFLNSSADGTLDIEADTQINLGTDTSGVAITIGHTTSEVTVADNLTVTGDLTVNGATTTIDTTNLLVEDPIIVLNKNNSSANGQGGIAIEQGGSTNDLVFGRVANDTWGVGTKDTSGGTVTTLADMTLATFRASKIEIDGANDTIDVTSSDLTAVASANFKVDAATDIILDADGADIFFDDGGTRFGSISMLGGNNMLALSSSVGNNIALMAQGGSVILSNNDGSNAGTFDLGTTNEVKLLDATDRARLILDSASGDGQTILSGTVQLDNGADVAELVFKEAAANGSNTITLDIPAAVGTSYTITLPASNGSTGQVLKLADGNGNLEFGSSAAGVSKVQMAIVSQLASGSALNPNSLTVSNTAPYTRAALDLSGIGGPDLDNLVDVYVNGQLLISGSDANVGAGTADYLISAHSATSQLKFGFALEVDDTVIINQKG